MSFDKHDLSTADITAWLRETDTERLRQLWNEADEVRRSVVGDDVHLRGLVEVSNHCIRRCAYCGLNATNRELNRYRMTDDEIMACAREAAEYGYGTVVLQAGEDYELTADWLAGVVRSIKQETELAVTLSMGERTEDELGTWKAAGADRYLLRFETSDPELYASIHPPLPGRVSDRFALLHKLRDLGYEIGSGVMLGIPGQTYQSLAEDIRRFAELDLDMVGVGPFIPHPGTPLGREARERRRSAGDEQVPEGEEIAYKVIALTRLVCPQSNIPSTTALATLNRSAGRERGLARGANVVMPNLTPRKYRALYEIYPSKVCISETARACHACMHGRILSLGRSIGTGQGARVGFVPHERTGS